MARFEDSPSMFGEGGGGSSYAEVECGICGMVRNEGFGVYEEGDSPLRDDDTETPLSDYAEPEYLFAGHMLCEDCAEKFENEILQRMPSILKWYRRYLDMHKNNIVRRLDALNGVTESEEVKSDASDS